MMATYKGVSLLGLGYEKDFCDMENCFFSGERASS